MNQAFVDKTLSLAGVAQAVALINNLAHTGQCATLAFETCIDSLFKIDTPNVPAVFGTSKNLQLGLTTLQKILQESDESALIHTRRYFIALLHLERSLMKNSEIQKKLRQGINLAQHKRDYFSPYHENVIFSLADLYKETIGQLNLKIHIIGKADYLHVREIADKCRALLLAGIRAAVLWHQTGGSRLKLIFTRQKYIECCKELLKQ
ncbi:MAG: high frequency lysogenization protein HflD [Legionellales bacterium]|nr:high frequency lysogenization protein HflD [Legionellales bacterium]